MSALEIKRVGDKGTCSVPRCGNGGRYAFYLAGYPILGTFGRELVCLKHSGEFQKIFTELAPSREYLEALIDDLGGKPTARCDAVDRLRGLGLSPEACARAVKETADGRAPSQVLDRMLGVVELEAVA